MALVLGSSLLAVVLCAALLEGVLRLAGFRYTLFPEKIEFGYPDPELFDTLYESDPDLFWVRKDYRENLERARGVDIVFMGDSCTEFGRYDQFLAERVQERTGKTFSYFNAGFGGWASWQGRRQLERDIVPLKPRVVTFYYGWNDHWIGFGIEDSMVASVNDSIIYTLRDWRIVQFAVGGWIARKNQGGALKRVSPVDFRANLTAMVRTAREHGIQPVLLTAPTSHRPGREPAHLANRWIPVIEDMVPLHQEYIQIVRDVARDEQVPLCDLAARFEELPAEKLVREYFKMDGIHFVPAGDRQVAAFLDDCLTAQGILDPVLHEDPNPIQIPGRTFPGEVNPPPKVPGDPVLPLLAEIRAVRVDEKGQLSIEGYAFSPDPIDYVVVHLGGRNLGIAIFPIASPDVSAQHPEYNDAFARFHFFRRLPIEEMKAAGGQGRVELYTGDRLLHVMEFRNPAFQE